MAKAKKTTTRKAGVKASAPSKTIKSKEEVKELIDEVSINATLESDEEVKSSTSWEGSSKVMVMNTCYNEILLNGGRPELCVRIAPKEMKQIDRNIFRDLMKSQVVRNWFDKGILTSNEDANETSAHEAQVPENLKGAVERTDNVSTVSASVKKFKKDGAIQINL